MENKQGGQSPPIKPLNILNKEELLDLIFGFDYGGCSSCWAGTSICNPCASNSTVWQPPPDPCNGGTTQCDGSSSSVITPPPDCSWNNCQYVSTSVVDPCEASWCAAFPTVQPDDGDDDWG